MKQNERATAGPFYEATRKTKDAPFYEATLENEGCYILCSITAKQRMDHFMKQHARNHFMKQLKKTHDGLFYYEATRNGTGWTIP
jgi:heat shock protein HspQ